MGLWAGMLNQPQRSSNSQGANTTQFCMDRYGLTKNNRLAALKTLRPKISRLRLLFVRCSFHCFFAVLGVASENGIYVSTDGTVA